MPGALFWPRRCRSEAGSFLLVAGWLVILGSGLVVSLSQQERGAAGLMQLRIAQARARTLARAGWHAALECLARDRLDEPYDWLSDDWSAPSDQCAPQAGRRWMVRWPQAGAPLPGLQGSLAIDIADEERRLDVNAASHEALAALLGDAVAADRLEAYRTRHGVTPISRLEELWSLSPLRERQDLRERLAAHATTVTGGSVNVNTADAETLMALGAPRVLAETVVQRRSGPDGRWGTPDDCVATSPADSARQLAACAGVEETALASLLASAPFGVRSAVFRVCIVAVADGATARMTGTVRRDAPAGIGVVEVGGRRFRALAWQEGAGATCDPPGATH